MAYTNQSTSSLADFISKLNTFLSTNGWTTHHSAANGEFAARKTASGVDVAFASQWDTTTPDNLGIYQWVGAAYNSGVSPWQQTDDSGNGAASTSNASLGGQRFANIGNTPVQFWCFEEDYYFHVVVQINTTDYVHFGAGALALYNDWTGGEYVYGHRQQTGPNTSVAVLDGTTLLLDGLCKDGTDPSSGMELFAATIHCESLPNQVAGGKYAVSMGNQGSSNLGNDRQTTPKARVHFTGGMRAGPGVLAWGQFYGNVASGLLPGYPLNTFYFDRSTGDAYGPMGRVKDVRGMSIRDYVAGQEITVGSDTWVIFPAHRRYEGTLTNSSGYQGIIYKKITP